MAVNITEGGSGVTYENQQRSDKSAQRGVMGEEGEDRVLMPRFIYSKLGNHTNQKSITLADMETESNEYKFFMMEMERLNDILEAGEEVPSDYDNIVLLDAYLGELGMETFYPFEDDMYGVPPWIDVTTQNEFRNVITHLTDIDGNEQNVITSVSGEDYNIIHRT
ncbi:MAG: hypothetical protein DRQ78_12395 [Epsilonproteobacteria bacterium]|nr:MAG: hypothetical protein DRQ78_12395 [Campylobacterota bacterium]